MNKAVPSALKQQIDTFCTEALGKLGENCDAQSYNELLTRWQEFHNSYIANTTAILQQWAEKYNSASEEASIIDKIEADSVVVEVIDQTTGQLFRRSLPITYLENSNGLVLSGETMEGKPSKIAFLSETAIKKINDLVGKGPDASVCDGHDH